MKSEELLQLVKSLLSTKHIPFSLIKDKVKFRRAHVVRLTLQGSSQQEIAHELGWCLSTIEKDLHVIRGGEHTND